VADDVGAAERRGLDETVVLVGGVPTGSAGVVVLPLRSGTGDGLAVGGDLADVAVSVDGGHNSKSREDGSSAGSVHLDGHVENCWVGLVSLRLVDRCEGCESERMSRSTVSGERK
jgi:hypothetical protein